MKILFKTSDIDRILLLTAATCGLSYAYGSHHNGMFSVMGVGMSSDCIPDRYKEPGEIARYSDGLEAWKFTK